MGRQTGGESRSRPLSEALEGALRRQIGVRWVRIRAQLDSSLRPDYAADTQAGVVRVPIPTRGNGLGWVLEVGLAPGQVLGDEHWRAIRRAVGVWELAAEFDRKGGALPRVLHAHSRVRDGAAPLIGSSPAMCHLRDRIERVAASDFTVLIEGESGSGKELVARQIHDLSSRRRNPFIALNCAAIVDTLLEAELFGIEDRTATGVKGGGANSNMRRAARSFSTRLPTCRHPPRPNCSAPSKNAWSSAWARTRVTPSTSASS